MTHKISRSIFLLLIFLACLPLVTKAQQTLGAINGTVTDTTNAVVIKAAVQVKNLGTGLTVNATTQNDGSYNIANLPIGTYSVSISKQGFKTEVHSNILVRGNLTTTVNATLQPGEVSSTVTVTGTPLLNQTDTTNGYTLGTQVIQSTPLGTGSFTQLAILAPGVSADLLSGSGTNAGLGNQNIWANGQRDTSNSFAFNGVNANNIFNGKSSSSVGSNRLILNTGESFLGGGQIQTGTSVYDAIGQGLPTPPPETIEELHVNTSMYDASQGANSGAHIELTTLSGTNDFHGQLYEYHQTTGWNANEFFFNAAGRDANGNPIDPRPALHRNTFGGTLGGPIIRNKLFFFASYQGQRVSDGENAFSGLNVPLHLTNDRSAAGLAAAANADFGTSLTANDIDPVAQKIMSATLPNGNFIIPTPTITNLTTIAQLGYDAPVQSTAAFTANQVNGNLDYDFGAKDRLSGKYYFQHNPSYSPFAVASVLGFPQSLNAGSQVYSVDNTTVMSPDLTWEQRAGFVREIAYAGVSQALTPSAAQINLFGSTRFPGIFIGNSSGNTNPNFGSLSVGPTSNFANAGIFQNQYELATNLNWFHGRHNISTGVVFDRNQLNVVNHNDQTAQVGFADFPGFLTGTVCSVNNFCSGISNSQLLTGSTNRYYRTSQVGAYVQDDFRIKSNLTLDAGLRWDWDGPLVEKHGFLTNFYATNYSCGAACANPSSPDPAAQFTNIGLVVAGNSKAFGTPGVSASTLTGRQWGFSPRIGLVWSPSFVKNFVVRTGFGMYYDRGEFFTELSPSAGGGISGPFGVTTEEPFVVPFLSPCTSSLCLGNPFGTTAPPPPPQNLSSVTTLLPNLADINNQTTPFCNATGQFECGPLFFGGYAPNNTLPYSENWTLDLQWQPTNTLLLDVAYVGNHGVHEVIPIPFNQAGIATPQNPINGESYSYGYTVPGVAAETKNTIVDGFGTGNAALRVPFIGYDPNSDFNMAEGISHYNALQVGVNKRLSHGLLVTGSYTWSHALDEGSGLQLFYNGNNPLDPRTAYGNSGFDRTHVFTLSYLYQIPKMARLTGVADTLVNGWGISGVTVAESGQPYSVIDFSGGVASLFYGGGQDAITNPIVPIGGTGATSTKAVLQGTTGVNPALPVLNAAAFGVPLLAPGQSGVPPCTTTGGQMFCDYYETGFGATGRNIFRGPFQTRFDFSVSKEFKLSERFKLRYDAQFFNIFNHPSFDTPNNNVLFNPFFGNPPTYPGSGCTADSVGAAYQCPPSGALGMIQHTLGSPRFIQMALHLTF